MRPNILLQLRFLLARRVVTGCLKQQKRFLSTGRPRIGLKCRRRDLESDEVGGHKVGLFQSSGALGWLELSMKKPVLLLLSFCLCLTQAFAQSSTVESERAEFATFSTKDHPKAKDVSFTISYPRSWSAEETEEPQIVQAFMNKSGNGYECVAIMVAPFPPESDLSKEAVKRLFSADLMKRMVPAKAKLIRATPRTFNGAPAGMLESSIHISGGETERDMNTVTLIFVYGHSMVQIQGQVGGASSKPKELAARFESLRSRFHRIIESIVFEK